MGLRCPLLADSGRLTKTAGGPPANVRFRPRADICTTKPMRERNPNPVFRRNVIIAFSAILVSRWLSRRVDEPWLFYVVAGLALIVMIKEVFKALSEWK